MSSILDAVLGQLTSSVVSAAAAHLGENEAGVSKAVKGVAATLLAGILGKSKDAAGLSEIFGMLTDKGNAAVLDDLGALVGGGDLAHGDPKDLAGRLVGSLFGDRTGGLLQAITAFGGLKQGSASSLLGLAGPLVMGVLGKHIATNNLTAEGFGAFMGTQAGAIREALPAGVGSLLGLADVADMTGAAKTAAAPAAAASATVAAGAAEARKTPTWMWAAPLILGAGVLLWFMMRGERPKVAETAPAAVETPAAPVEAPPAAPAVLEQAATAAGQFVKTIGAGFELKGASGGVEEKLVGFIDSGREPCTDAGCWFSFDRLTFNTGSAELDMAKSSEQIANIAEILKAYPGLQLKIGGYTDNTGSEDANMKLSQARADAVVKAVEAQGVEPGRLVAEGYGAQFPRASNDTEEGRAMNRRIDVRVRKR